MKYLSILFLLFCFGCTNIQNSDVYCLRGMGEVFSNGLDNLASEIQSEKGVKSISLSWTEREGVTRSELGERPLFLIGHSYGADNAVEIAYALKDKGIKVDYLFLFDSTNPKPIPDNVLHCVHWYVETIIGDAVPVIFPGNPVKLEDGNAITDLENRKMKDSNHFNIDSNKDIKNFIKQKIYSYYG